MTLIRSTLPLTFIAVLFASPASIAAPQHTELQSLEGTWVMTAAYEVLADGRRTTNYGEHPHGLLMVDARGRYSLQIFRPDRPKFASGVKATGTAAEYRNAVVGSSTHTGRVALDASKRQLTFTIETSSYPNWEGTQQVRAYSFADDTLTYSVPASASGNGTVAYSIWKRAD
jgi:hypothetical protein